MFLASYYIFKNTLESSLLWFWYLPTFVLPKKNQCFFFGRSHTLGVWRRPFSGKFDRYYFGVAKAFQVSSDLNEGFFGWDSPEPSKSCSKSWWSVVTICIFGKWDKPSYTYFHVKLESSPNKTSSARNPFEVWVLVLSLFWEGGPGVSNLYRNHYGLHST